MNIKHGFSKTSFYARWYDLNKRCYLKTNKAYKNYGGRGIKCNWKSFENFRDDMYQFFLEHIENFGEKNTTLERIDNDGNYCKENCCWATRREQSRNRRFNRYIYLNGEKKIMSDWSRDLGIGITTIAQRIRYGWPENKLLLPVGALKNG